jgi:hypothetical protein
MWFLVDDSFVCMYTYIYNTVEFCYGKKGLAVFSMWKKHLFDGTQAWHRPNVQERSVGITWGIPVYPTRMGHL